MTEYRKSSHSVSNLTIHLVWVTKYKYSYKVLTGNIQKRCREILVQVCNSEDVRILNGVVSKDYIHVHIEYPPSLSISDLVKRQKGEVHDCSRKSFRICESNIGDVVSGR